MLRIARDSIPARLYVGIITLTNGFSVAVALAMVSFSDCSGVFSTTYSFLFARASSVVQPAQEILWEQAARTLVSQRRARRNLLRMIYRRRPRYAWAKPEMLKRQGWPAS